jgi:uncharacterized membrane protein YdcZ (DUF606 family)
MGFTPSIRLKHHVMKTLAILLIVIGGIMTVFTGFNLVTKKEVADIGPIEVTKTEKTPIYWSPITGAILLIAGILVMVSTKRGSSV